MDFCPSTLQTKSLIFSAKLKMKKMRFKCKPENRMYDFIEMLMKQMLECILMPKSCHLDQVCCKIWESWKLRFNWQKFAQKKLNFWLLNSVCICQKTSTQDDCCNNWYTNGQRSSATRSCMTKDPAKDKHCKKMKN